ncbi:MAG: hypothetical protein HUU46_07670 [Candidatus Hydrogenedentes bacterium]|nr:hypothetical protein [Candidatus Hydrogenedentota bacterium]
MIEQHLEYTECYVAFLDILGFEQIVRESERNPDVLRRLVLMLNEAANIAPPEKWVRDLGTGESKQWRMQVRSFSDSIVLFVPTESQMIASVLETVRFLYDCLLEMDCCLRGAVTIGNMYWHDMWSADAGRDSTKASADAVGERVVYERFSKSDLPITLGPGLVEAYRLESCRAKHPRIIVSNALYEHIKRVEREDPVKRVPASPLCSPDPHNSDLWITDFLREDSDSLRFLDILHPRLDRHYVIRQTISRTDDGKTIRRNVFNNQSREEWLSSLREFIARHLGSSSDVPIRGKYLWFAGYLNACLAAENVKLAGLQPISLGLPAE